jgi:hypothetical protein
MKYRTSSAECTHAISRLRIDFRKFLLMCNGWLVPQVASGVCDGEMVLRVLAHGCGFVPECLGERRAFSDNHSPQLDSVGSSANRSDNHCSMSP